MNDVFSTGLYSPIRKEQLGQRLINFRFASRSGHYGRGPVTASREQAAVCVLRRGTEALQALLGIVVARIELQRRAVVGCRLVALAELLVDYRPRSDVVSVVGLQRHGLVGIGQAFGVLTLRVIGPGAIIISFAVIGLERDRRGEIGNGLDRKSVV